MNSNFLSPFGYNFSLKRAPSLNFAVQSVKIPGMSLGQVSVPTPFVRIPLTGNKLKYSDLEVTFKITEDMDSYLEIFNWMVSIGYPDNYKQYADISKQQNSVYSDCNVTILNSSNNPKFSINFVDAFPTGLSDIEFESTDNDVKYLTATASFAFMRYYYVDNLNG